MTILDQTRKAIQSTDYVLQEFGERVKVGEYIALYSFDGREKVRMDRATLDALVRENRLKFTGNPEEYVCRYEAV